MISDTLHDAAEKIRADLAEFPDAFAGDREEILKVLWHMDQLRATLDTPPAAVWSAHLHPEPDDSYRRRIVEIAIMRPLKPGERQEIETAIGHALDAIGEKFQVARYPQFGKVAT